MKEVWEFIPGYEGYYQVSNIGRIRSVDRIVKHPTGSDKKWKGRILKQNNQSGYCMVDLCKEGERTNELVHRLIAKAFIPNPENKPCVNHLDCDKTNNKLSNLSWCTYSENEKHSYRNGKKPNKTGLGRKGLKNVTSIPIIVSDLNKVLGIYPSSSIFADIIDSTQGRVSAAARGDSSHHRGYLIEQISRKRYKQLKKERPELVKKELKERLTNNSRRYAYENNLI